MAAQRTKWERRLDQLDDYVRVLRDSKEKKR
jgi:hypothetical protein